MTELDEILNTDSQFRYRLLSRMQADCAYYLGYGNRCCRHLWAGNERDQIMYMKALWDSFPKEGKPEWLPYEKILEYESRMVPKLESLSMLLHAAEIQSSAADSSSKKDQKREDLSH